LTAVKNVGLLLGNVLSREVLCPKEARLGVDRQLSVSRSNRRVLQLGGLGFVRAKTLKAFPETAYREIIRPLG
jgi:hypothetical protein